MKKKILCAALAAVISATSLGVAACDNGGGYVADGDPTDFHPAVTEKEI